ncbi:uncharacterized protein PAC_03500 [Phialocephala subalpina]|uniref:Uncharacterized protein n=1 Tax=Phialocephala subalpina TaxID=576137 RepID=A0A1L7WLI2_9HELO|nr:uncharacterized protein PAC_03500 [Phialocephala subalpina]
MAKGAINFVAMVIYLPETSYARGLIIGDTAGDVERTEIARESKRLGVTATSTLTPVSAAPELLSMNQNLWYISHPYINYKENWFRNFIGPFQFFLSPVVLWSSITYAVAAGAFTAVGVCIPQLTAPPPYNFNSGAQGLFGLCALIGVILGGTISSKIVDVFNSRMEKRRFKSGEEHKPEERLVMLILPFFTCTTGLVMYGVTIGKGIRWIVPAVGYTMNCFGFAILASITYSYAVDSYLVRSAEVMVFNNTCRALISFGFANFSPGWLAKVGPGQVYSIFAAAIWALLLLAIPMFYFGPKLRAVTNRFL